MHFHANMINGTITWGNCNGMTQFGTCLVRESLDLSSIAFEIYVNSSNFPVLFFHITCFQRRGGRDLLLQLFISFYDFSRFCWSPFYFFKVALPFIFSHLHPTTRLFFFFVPKICSQYQKQHPCPK